MVCRVLEGDVITKNRLYVLHAKGFRRKHLLCTTDFIFFCWYHGIKQATVEHLSCGNSASSSFAYVAVGRSLSSQTIFLPAAGRAALAL